LKPLRIGLVAIPAGGDTLAEIMSAADLGIDFAQGYTLAVPSPLEPRAGKQGSD
jgi:EAL domain-containing protein (putative c-di-GMP-specific phosphodiesterase class I)